MCSAGQQTRRGRQHVAPCTRRTAATGRRPTSASVAVSFAEPTPIPNGHLKDDGQPMLFGVGDQMLANGVVDLFLVASLPTGKPFECPAAGFARLLAVGVCLRLQPRSDVGAVEAIVGEVLPLKLVSCGIRGDMPKSQVHAEGALYLVVLGRVGRFVFHLNVKVKTVFPSSLERRTGGLLPASACRWKSPKASARMQRPSIRRRLTVSLDTSSLKMRAS